jgi:hypothetical protein
MPFTKASLVSVGLVGALALGLSLGSGFDADGAPPLERVVSAATAPEAAAVTVAAPLPSRPYPPRLERVPTASARPVQERVKGLLNRGADVRKAAEGFPNALQLMTVAHAARNTDIPFMVLKHRVLVEGKPLTAAIAELKPELNEVAEAKRARAEARADLSRLSGSL